MNTNDPRFEMIRRHHDGEASPEDLVQLESSLRDDPDFREAYVRYMNLDVALSSFAEGLPIPKARAVVKPGPWLHWHPLAAAAAGLMIGLFSATMVFAYAVPRARTDTQRTAPLFVQGFEDGKALRRRGFPTLAGEWSGDLSAPVASEGDVAPKEGEHMVRLVSPNSRNFTFAAIILDLSTYPPLPGEESRQVEVTASFHGAESGTGQRHQIRLAAFGEQPGAVKAIWNGPNMFGNVLQHVGRTVPLKPGDQGWKTLKATMDIPPGARSLVIWLAAGVVDDSTSLTAHYLDDVHAQFLIKDATP